MTATFTTPDLSCGGCAATIRSALLKQPGVLAVHVAPAVKRVEVAFDPATTSADRLAAALAAAGYPPQRGPRPSEALPDARLDAALA